MVLLFNGPTSRNVTKPDRPRPNSVEVVPPRTLTTQTLGRGRLGLRPRPSQDFVDESSVSDSRGPWWTRLLR